MALPSKEQMLYSQAMFVDSVLDYINGQIGDTKFETYEISMLTSILQYTMRRLQTEMHRELQKEEKQHGPGS